MANFPYKIKFKFDTISNHHVEQL